MESSATIAPLLRAVQDAGAAPIHAPPGTALFRPGDPCRGFLVLAAGCVRVSLTSAGGREIVLYRVQPGEICLQTFSCLAEGRAYAAEGVAETILDGWLLPPGAFERLSREDPAFRTALFAAIAARFSDFEQVVEALAFAGLAERIAGALLRLAGADHVVTATHEALAAEIGSAREAVSRQLAVLAQQGLIRMGRGRIDLVRRDALTRLAHPSG